MRSTRARPRSSSAPRSNSRTAASAPPARTCASAKLAPTLPWSLPRDGHDPASHERQPGPRDWARDPRPVPHLACLRRRQGPHRHLLRRARARDPRHHRTERRRHMDCHAAAKAGIARTFQNIALFKGMTVLDNIMTGRNLKMRSNFLLQALYWGPGRKEEIAHREKAEAIIDFLEIQAIRKTPVGRLPYGLQKRVELGRALAAEPDILLLDEPMAGMNVEEKQDMCRFIL